MNSEFFSEFNKTPIGANQENLTILPDGFEENTF